MTDIISIEEQRVLAAEFVGLEPCYSDGELVGYLGTDGRMKILGQFHPDKDWNEMIEVATKIKTFIVPEQKSAVDQYDFERVHKRMWANIKLSLCCLNINMVWEEAIKFIQWYNNQSK